MTEENTGALSAAEEAYFESGGEALPAEETTQPEVTTEAAPETTQQPESGVERDEKGRFVPHGALHAEREEHKRTKSELAEIRQKQAVLEDRWNTLLSLQAKPEQAAKAEDTPPDPNEDIFAYAKWQGDKLAALESRIAQDQQRQQQTVQEQQQEAAIWNEWSQSAQSFAAQTPDFGDAVSYLSDLRDKQLQALSVADPNFANHQARVQQINAELKQIITAAKQKGINPAEAVYTIAKGYGFAGAQPQAKNELGEKLAAIDAAQNASRTLAATTGKPAGDALDAAAIASMSAADFSRWIADPANERIFNKMMGG